MTFQIGRGVLAPSDVVPAGTVIISPAFVTNVNGASSTKFLPSLEETLSGKSWKPDCILSASKHLLPWNRERDGKFLLSVFHVTDFSDTVGRPNAAPIQPPRAGELVNVFQTGEVLADKLMRPEVVSGASLGIQIERPGNVSDQRRRDGCPKRHAQRGTIERFVHVSKRRPVGQLPAIRADRELDVGKRAVMRT